MEKPYRLAVKLPAGAEFEAEGEEGMVKFLFAQFLEAIKTPIPTPIPASATTSRANPALGAPDEANGTNQVPTASSVDRAILERLFAVDKTGTVSLRALPRGDDREAEALVALLMGFNELRGETDVSAVRLMRAARQSGIQIARLDRTIDSQSQYINSAGFGKGKRYGLNNPGMVRAQEILKSILG